MAHDVFVSHSVKDKLVADAIVTRLEAESVRCWVAPRDVVPGADWGESIVNAIESSRIMILVFSRNANASRQIKREVERADDKGVYTIPFRIDDIEPTKSLEYFISTAQWMDAFVPPLEQHLDTLVKTVGAVLANPPPREPVPNESTRIQVQLPTRREAESSPDKTKREVRIAPRSWIFVAAIAAILIVAAAGWYFSHERSLAQTSASHPGDENPAPKFKQARDEAAPKVVQPAAAPAANSQALPAETQTRTALPAAAPVDVVRRYYDKINERSVEEAYECLSQSFKSRLSPEQFSQIFADTQTIAIRRLRRVSLNETAAVLAIGFVEMDSDNRTHEWTGNVYLVKEGDAWRIDRTALKSDRGAAR